jgi:hypothetical protein
MSDHTLNSLLARKVSRLARQIGEIQRQAKEDYVTDEKEFDDLLRRQEGVLPRRGTLLGPESEDRYKKGIPIHDATGKFRRSDAKG